MIWPRLVAAEQAAAPDTAAVAGAPCSGAGEPQAVTGMHEKG